MNPQIGQQVGISELETSLLELIFVNNLNTGNQLNVKKFRAQNHEHLDLLDSLLQSNYITQIADKYYLKIEALFEIESTQPEAKKYIDIAKQLFILLQKDYLDDPERVIPLKELAEESKQSRHDLNIVLSYMADTPNIIGGRSIDLTQEDAYICPIESILKYKSLDEVVEKVRGWRQPRNIEKNVVINFAQRPIGDFSFLLHAEVIKHALAQYQHGHLRDAVLNSMVAAFDYIRLKTGLKDEDGDALIGKVFSLDKPLLILSELDTESGRNDQKGFMQIFKGAYQGIRNPKAHKLDNDLNALKAAQYLVFASMLIRRVEEATLVAQDKNN